MNHHLVRDLAAHLAKSHDTSRPVPMLEAFHDLCLDDAYRVQALTVANRLLDEQSHPVGWKLSGTNGPDQPMSGVLLASALLPAPEFVSLDEANGPLVEPELVFRITRDVSHHSSLAELADCVEVAAAIEIPQSRFADWWPVGERPNITRAALVADNAASFRIAVASGWQTFSAAQIDSITCTLTLPDGSTREGRAGDVYGSPLRALSWLLNWLHGEHRVAPVGALVSSGTFTVPAHATAGRFSANFGHAGAVEVDFVHGA
ncbi:2-keto-4-pentenoate hydratase [Nocardioides alcanivorans]|uniref:2-keto-4-pentenoate hydratase n=1 Tax=Nocardioides alcanivorans TaxID=2897352 RepID=UPI001F3181C6|nr:hypothetical protein [Nocardioides alcanivorans]